LEIPSATLRYDIDARIYTPPCYSADQQRYPVLYLIHGLSFTEDQWLRLGIAAAADRLIRSGDIAPLIIVMPRDRLDDRFDPAIVKDLLPYIDSRYRTRDSGPYRAIGGLSRGGGWSIHLGLHYPEKFGRIGAHSPAIFYGDEKLLLQWTRAILKQDRRPAIYIDIGDGDGQRQSAFWLDQVFTSTGLQHTYLVQSGGHSEKYWSAHLADYLRFYAAGWRAEPLPTATPNSVEQ
jgi:enterochelin esterase-like enzyme